MTYAQHAQRIQPQLVDLRRAIHKVPELGLDLPHTQNLVLQALDGLPLEITLGKSLSSVASVLRCSSVAPTVLLRADMDALPVAERTGLDYQSVNTNMHACGHDLHIAMLVGAARLLAANARDLRGNVIFMFQPGEEGFDGAKLMLDEGLLEQVGQPVIAAYGLHVLSSRVPPHVFASKPGILMAANDTLRVTVLGRGGHGSQPDKAKDPIVVAAELVTSLQTLVTRNFDVFDSAIITVGTFNAGTKNNIIPDEASFEATIRTFSEGVRSKVRSLVTQLCTQLPSAYGLRAEVNYANVYPPTVNDAAEFTFLAETARAVFGSDRFVEMDNPAGGSEDFSRVLSRVPGAYAYLGACPSDRSFLTAATNHSAFAEFDDAVLWRGACLLAELATRRLADGR